MIGALGVHDLGGVAEAFGPVNDKEATITAHWQSRVDALSYVLFKKQIVGVDEFRRFIEALPVDSYNSFHYYGKWATSLFQILLRKGLIAEKDVFEELYGPAAPSQVLYKEGDNVKVLRFNSAGLFRRPHLRTPGYVFGKRGVIQSIAGSFLPPG
jgi:hypothetical protein